MIIILSKVKKVSVHKSSIVLPWRAGSSHAVCMFFTILVKRYESVHSFDRSLMREFRRAWQWHCSAYIQIRTHGITFSSPLVALKQGFMTRPNAAKLGGWARCEWPGHREMFFFLWNVVFIIIWHWYQDLIGHCQGDLTKSWNSILSILYVGYPRAIELEK